MADTNSLKQCLKKLLVQRNTKISEKGNVIIMLP